MSAAAVVVIGVTWPAGAACNPALAGGDRQPTAAAPVAHAADRSACDRTHPSLMESPWRPCSYGFQAVLMTGPTAFFGSGLSVGGPTLEIV